VATKRKRKQPAYASDAKVIKVRRRRYAGDDDENARDGLVSSVQFWKSTDEKNAAAALFSWIDRLRPKWVSDNLEDLIHEAIYEGRPLGAQDGGGYGLALTQLRQRRSAPANLNITRSMVDTATARLTKRRPMPVISADDASWSEKRFARKMSRVIRRKMGGSEVEKVSPSVIRDFIIRGTGCLKVVRCGGDTKTERIPVREIVVDPRESYYGPPRTMAHHRPVSRDVLAAEFPEYEQEILDAATFKPSDPWSRYAYGDESFADHVEVAEAWHVPSVPYDPDYPDKCDGDHIIAIRGCTIFREKWTRPRFPVACAYWSAPQQGFRGHGLVEDLTGIQAKVNDVVRDIQEALYYGSTLKVLVPRSSNVNKHHLRARHPVVIEYDGAPPQYVGPNPVSNQAVQFLEMLIQKAYDIAGISQLSASSKSTLGSNASGKALDTMEDIQSDRFAHVESGYMQFRVEVGQLHIDEARQMYMEAKAEGASEMKRLAPWIRDNDWARIEIDGGSYHLTIEPINFLPDTRAGKLSAVAELSKAGLIPDPTMTADLFDEPDIARANRTILGPKHRLDEVMEGLADTSVPMMDLLPDEYDNLELGVLMAKGELKEAQANHADESELERYREWIGAAKAMVDKSKAAPMGSPSLPGMMDAGMGPAPNAMTLQPGLAGPPGQPGPAMPPLPPGMPMVA
jgi:hypothetical protein